MTTQNLTDWFNLDEQKPWEPGVYIVDEDYMGTWFSYWDGAAFCQLSTDKERAEAYADIATRFRVYRWRGLSSDPNAKPAPEPKPKARGNRKVTRYVVAETVGLYTSHIDPNAIHGSYSDRQIAEDVAKRLRDSGSVTARVFKTKRFRTPEAD